jgi:hypothetical protein
MKKKFTSNRCSVENEVFKTLFFSTNNRCVEVMLLFFVKL